MPLAQTFLLHHDSAHPYFAAATKQTNRNLKFEILPHPPYSLDLAPCDFQAFGPLKEALGDRRLSVMKK
jgi:hypothetical protein